MNDREKAAFMAGGAFGIIAGVVFMVFVIEVNQNVWKTKAIEHGAARYNATSGAFEWIEKVEVPE